MTLQPFGHGDGVGLFLAPSIEYHRHISVFGFKLSSRIDRLDETTAAS